MKNFFKLLLALIFIPCTLSNMNCFAKDTKANVCNHSKKANAAHKKNKVKPIKYKIQQLENNAEKVDIIMHMPYKKNTKQNPNDLEIHDLKNGKISKLGKKVSTVNIDGKQYIKIEFSYVVKIKSKSKKKFTWPVPGFSNVTSDFYDSEGRTRIHGAVDISGEKIKNSKVVAAHSGKVIVANTEGWGGGYGKYVIIDHGDGENTLYGHMENVKVKVDEMVSSGQEIGTVGETGFATGPHLHFEYRVNGVRTDPADILDIPGK